jgi:hypothetical protein
MGQENVTPKERVIVTLKPNPHDAGGRALYKIVGPNNNGIQIRSGNGFHPKFVQPFLHGAKELKVWAFLDRNGRWQLIDVVQQPEKKVS